MSPSEWPGEWRDGFDKYRGLTGGGFVSVQAHVAALYVALLKADLMDEAAEFAEWVLDTFDHDLES